MRVALAVLIVVPVLAGCVGPDAALHDPQRLADASGPVAVVALVDTGINPYHEVFQDADARLPDIIKDELNGAKPVPLHLTQDGTASERYAADKLLWDNLEPNTLYWFVGTRVLAMSPGRPAAGPLIYADGGHGTGLASIVRNVSHETWIVMVPDLFDIGHHPTDLAAQGALSAVAIRWLSAQSWVDVISLSLGYPGNPPAMWDQVTEATRTAALAGKVVVSGAGDEPPLPNIQTGTSGPPWVVSVGGAEPSTHGMASGSSTTVDVRSDYTRRLATNGTDHYRTGSGTSFSAPVVAGVLGEALLRVREDARDASRAPGVLCTCDGRQVTSGSLRAALNVSAEYWSAAQWEPLNYSSNPVMVVGFLTLPVAPAPWLQMGWGYIGNASWSAVVAALEGRELPPKPAEAAQYMAEQQALREAYWATVPYAS